MMVRPPGAAHPFWHAERHAGRLADPAGGAFGFAVEQAGSDLPNIGYARVYPLATVAKILLAQLLIVL
jgi:putative transport protein